MVEYIPFEDGLNIPNTAEWRQAHVFQRAAYAAESFAAQEGRSVADLQNLDV